MTRETSRRSVLAGLSLLTATGAQALAQRGNIPAPVGGAQASAQ